MRQNRIKLFLVAMSFFIFSFFSHRVHAATYYVSTNGNDVNSGTSNLPFKTIQHAADIVRPGDTVIVEDGTYVSSNDVAEVTITTSGSASAPITFKSKNKWGAVISGSSSFGIYLLGSYINVTGFKVEGFHFIGIYGGGGGGNYYISDNNVGPIAQYGAGSNGAAGIDFNSSSGSNTIIDGNVVHDVGGGSDCTSNWNSCADHGIDYEYGNSSNITIINNVCYNNTRGWDVQFYGGSRNNVNIVGNVFASTNPLRSGQIIIAEPVSNLLIADNIFYHPGVYEGNYAVVDDHASSGYVLKYNLTTVSAMDNRSTVGTSNILNIDPSFVSPSNYDFHLQSDSPAIGKGIAWSGRAYDADGKTLPNTPDVGAYEYGSSVSSSSNSSSSSDSQNNSSASQTSSNPSDSSTINAQQPTDDASGKSYSITDALKLVAGWFAGNLSSDVNNDGVVNIQDLGIIMSRW